MPITGIGASANTDPVASLVTALTTATSTLSTRQVIAGTGLTGGGTLAADRTLAVDYASSGVSSTSKAVRADDARLFGMRQSRYGSWADIPTPFVIPHRGAGEMVAPENTMEAFRVGVDMGFGAVDGGDFRQLPDGTLAAMHDRDMRRTSLTGLSVNVDDLSAQAWRQVVINAGTWFGGNWGNLSAPTARQLFAEFGGSVLMTPEPKNDSGTNASTALIQAILDYGMKRTAMFCSLTLSDCVAALAAGITSACYIIPSTATPVATFTAQLSGTGVQYVALDFSSASTATISAYIAAGYKVVLYTPTRQKDKTTYDALGVSGYWSNDPLYFAGDVTKYRKTTAPWVKSGTFYHGHQSPTSAVDSNRGTFVGSAGAYRWQQTQDSYILQGWACPVANAASSYTITDPVTFDTVIGDTSRHTDMFVCQATDHAYNNQGSSETWANGYFCLLRATGSLSAYKVTAGVAALIGTSTSPTAIVSGGTATITCAVTPTTVTFSRSDVGGANNTVTITDSAFRGGYFYLGTQGATAGQRVSHGAVTIT
jgi:glycerophosphoryl diester phosphodiesterase